MSAVVLDWVCRRLAGDDEIIQPLNRLWMDWNRFHTEPSYDAFAATVLSDERIETLYTLDIDPAFEVAGCFSGPRIKLRMREISAQSVLAMFRCFNEQIAKVLLEVSELYRGTPGDAGAAELQDALQIIESLRPAFTPWVHLRPVRRRPGSRTA